MSAQRGAAAPISRRRFLSQAAVVTGGGAAVLLAGGVRAASPNEPTDRSAFPLARAHGASEAQRWMELLYDSIRVENFTPNSASRAYAYAAIALYEAVLGGMPDFRSLSGQLTAMPRMPAANPRERYDWPSAGSAAMATAARRLLANGTPATLAAVEALATSQLEGRRLATRSDRLVERSAAHGRAVGTAVMDWADADGLSVIRAMPAYVPVVGPDKWRPTPPNFGVAIEPYWGLMRPFVLPSADACQPPPPIPYSEEVGSAFYAQAKRVHEVGLGLTAEQRATAIFWRDNPLTSGLPSGHWTMIETQLIDQLGLSLDRAAEMYARTGVALADSFISCWHEKYRTNLLRPISYIHAHIDPTWASWVNTPQFPEYTSGHSVASRAAATVLTDLFGSVPFVDTHRMPGLGTRSFPSFDAAANEAANSRLLGGIHYPMGIETGMEQGDWLGAEVLARLRTRRQ